MTRRPGTLRTALRTALLTVTMLTVTMLGCSGAQRNAGTVLAGPPLEVEVTLLPLAGPLSSPTAELSGLAWRGDDLILLAQYPDFQGSRDPQRGYLFALKRARIEKVLDGGSGPLTPRAIPFFAPGLAIEDFDGFEAIAFVGDLAYLIAEQRGDATRATLLRGVLAPDLSRFDVDVDTLRTLPSQAGLDNNSDEALVLHDGAVHCLHEINGEGLNPRPLARRFDLELRPREPLGFPALPYRVTDASAVDAQGRFWVINYLWPEDGKLLGRPDPLTIRWGQGPSHARRRAVERLVELQFAGDEIELVKQAPLQLLLSPDGRSRNWEGLVRLGERGFLLVSDSHPATLLGFVAPARES